MKYSEISYARFHSYLSDQKKLKEEEEVEKNVKKRKRSFNCYK